MRRFLCIMLLTIAAMAASNADAQEFTNNWIDFSQDYYRIGIPRTGVYRVSRSQLQAAGVPLGNFNPQNIQLYQNGKPIACHIDGEKNGLLNYIEFYAEGNSGWFDTEMFDKPENQTNPYYSLITDTAAVFLTWNSGFSNLRHTTVAASGADGREAAGYCIIDTICQFVGTYMSGEENCLFTEAEGWFDGSALSLGQKLTKTVPTPGVKTDGKATISLALGTYSSQGHHITLEGPGIGFDTIFYGLRTIRYKATIDAAKLQQQNKFTFASVNNIDAKTDYSRVSFIEVEYPSDFNFSNRQQQIFSLPPATNDLSITISGMELDQDAVLYDITRNLRIGLVVSDGKATALIPSHSTTVKLVVASGKAVRQPSSISHSPFTNHAVSGNPILIVTHASLMTKAKEYASYRGGYLVDVDELYNQFGYGIRKHPMAIRHFIEYATAKWTIKPEYLFLMGKGVSASDMRKNATAYSHCLVPPMGVPASDALLSAYVNGRGIAPSLATGRLSVLNQTDLANYFDKVKEFEANQPADWMKRIVHFIGGNKGSEQDEIKRYMLNYESIISDTLFGGVVTKFIKNTSDPISTSKNDSVKKLINSGVSLMTFFGHGSAGGGFDQDIDVPSFYQNKGKYPLILSNSCYVGNIFGTWQGTASEEWVLTKSKGAIGLIAMVNEGRTYYLDKFSANFYRQLAYGSYGEPMGKAMCSALSKMAPTSDRLLVGTIQQMVLHGDPCIVLNSPPKPDLQVASSDVWFTPSLITSAIDSFSVNVAVRNVGRSVTSAFQVNLQYTSPGGTVNNHVQQLDILRYTDTLHFTIPINRLEEAGLVRFSIMLDAMGQIDELNEDNNRTDLSNYIVSADLAMVSPYRYSLMPQAPQTLKATGFDVLSGSRQSIFQIDTTERFISKTIVTQKVDYTGGIAECNLKQKLDEGRVYFWRAKNADADNYPTANSFVARNGLTGWEQSHFEQLDDNDFSYIVSDVSTRSYKFAPAARTLRCHNIGSPNSGNFMKLGYDIEGYSGFSSCGNYNAMLVVVVDSFLLEPWHSNRGRFGHSNYPHCSLSEFEKYFIFYTGNLAAGLDSLISMVDNHVPNGNYILIYNFMSGRFQQWPERAYAAFERWGATQIRNVNSSVPYIFFTHKGHPDEAEEVIGTSATDQIDFHRTLYNSYNFGTITSPEIGPARQWAGVEWEADAIEQNSQEETFVRVLGCNDDNWSVVIDSITDSNADLSQIDARQFSRLKLQFFTRDDSSRTPSQLRMWRVLYTPFTDLAVNTSRQWSFFADTLAEGQTGRVSMAFTNIGQQPSAPVLVHYWIQTDENRIAEIGYKRLKALQPGESVTDTVEFATVGLFGDNVFYAELNPYAEGSTQYDQMEQTHFNNFVYKMFHVVTDKLNPLMDVTFDGLHIHDGDIVSAHPLITVSVVDANLFLTISDTSSISVYLTPLSTGIERRVGFADISGAEFTPGTPENNTAQLLLPMDFDDGQYQLRVSAHDASGNESGADDYIISFRVITKNTVSDVYAFPNPFGASTRFGFELTGSQLPDELLIDIYNPMGKIVKTLTMNDFGSLHFGQNLSAEWHGTDSNGALLPTGVYFYKARISSASQPLPIRNEPGRPGLTGGVGRIIIVR